MNAIELNQVVKRFSNGSQMTTLFNDMNFTVREGELVVISGEEGTGKSTLLRMLAAMTPANKGSVHVFGEDLLTIRKRTEWRLENIGYINEEGVLIPYLSARQNLLLGLKPDHPQYKEKYKQAAEILMDLGFSEEKLDESIEGLDDKHQILASIGRILMTSPKLILADEPTKALDGPEGEAVLDRLMNFAKKQGLTVIAVTNDETIRDQADRHFSVENCQLVEKNEEGQLH
ncbi:ATP-binding cassette domain-containing protein [Salipaludibacillus sp. CUR1]|uniref:ABC transporter ATP-binding protein n=1 Tax=Salipaludibacillus sp. CUR1 TaxID=2820003 RepID=UPI001E392012|nr:ATP-binding cassette domain-containing protein [Salipaludibacillus sp. CUR1]MCE7794778.1 ATP-binding cassette domain-containing protein [Salipaludibacillus sp. CUR1]